MSVDLFTRDLSTISASFSSKTYLKVERSSFLDDVDVDEIGSELDHFVLDVVGGGAENVLVGLHALLLIPD